MTIIITLESTCTIFKETKWTLAVLYTIPYP